MCGVTGVYSYGDHAGVDRPLMARMTKSIAHRGPDDEGTYFDDSAGLALGIRRLSIIDLAGGHQPMANEDEKVWLVFNGEIYNYRDLRAELSSLSHVFRTASDTETIIHSWEQWGMDGLARLNGMFGLALWDQRARTLILARDPFGVKPLYYWDNGSTILFGSELRTLLCHPAVRAEVDPAALDEFISLGFVPSPRTAFKGIRKLPPGHALRCSPAGVSMHRYSRRGAEPAYPATEAEMTERLAELVERAVKRQMVADVPIGVMLSGGVDSSAVAAIVSRAAGRPIDTFTVGFTEHTKYSEAAFAREAARRIGSRHHEVEVSAGLYRDFLPLSIEYLEEPVATASTLAFHQVCRLARQHVKVVLTGQGADEPFAGYDRHLGERYGSFYRAIPAALRRGIIKPFVDSLPRNEQLKRAVFSLGIRDDLERLASIYSIVDTDLKKALYRSDLLEHGTDGGREVIGSWLSDIESADPVNRMTYVDSRLSLPDNLLLYGDKMSMANSLEARVPFLDLELMEFVEGLPARFKIKGRTQKSLLKKAVSRWIPREAIERKKIGFAIPVDEWFQHQLLGVRDRFEAADSACRAYFNMKTVNRILDDHAAKRHDYKRILFSLLTFEIWHGIFVRRRGASMRSTAA